MNAFKIAMIGVIATSALVACSGGGGIAPAGSATHLSITYRGTATLSTAKTTQSLAGTPVTAALNGATIATGTLDAAGHADLNFSVSRGSRIQVTAGRAKPTVKLATRTQGTITQVDVTSNNQLDVQSTDDVNEDGTANNNDDENQQNDVEDIDGVIVTP